MTSLKGRRTWRVGGRGLKVAIIASLKLVLEGNGGEKELEDDVSDFQVG